MPTFRYQAYTRDGKPMKGRREGLNAKDVREQLLAEGLYAREVRSVDRSGAGGGLSAAQRGLCYRELGALLHAGLPLDRALGVLADHPELAKAADAMSAIRDMVREGGSLSQAFGERVPGVRGDETAVLAAGEASGRLAEVSLELADHLEAESEVGDQVRTALVYPAVVCVLALGVVGVLVGVLLPMYEELLTGMNRTLPWITRALLAVGRGMRHPVGLMILVSLLLGSFVAVYRSLKHPERLMPRRRFGIPVLGRGLSALARARFARTLSLLLEGGVSLPDSLRVAGRATGSVWLNAHCATAADRISGGDSLGAVLGGMPVLSEDLPGWAAAGEASGDLAGLMRHASRSHQRAWDRGLRRSLALLEPLLIVGVGLLILLVALAVLLPMLQVNRGLIS